jgi:predicted ATP-dependent endonuclease of OLD family
MNIKRLQLTRMRTFEQAEFDFNPGMNLLVGVNGVGKTTVLDALRICLSRVIPDVTASQSRPLAFNNEDIRGMLPSLTALMAIQVGGQEFQYVHHQQRENIVTTTSEALARQERELRNQRRVRRGRLRRKLRDLQETREIPDIDTYTPELGALKTAVESSSEQLLGVFFSTRRSLVSDAVPSLRRAAGGPAAAFAEALISRELRLAELAYWIHAQEELTDEHPQAKKHLAALQRVAKGFLPECKNLRAETSPKPRLIVTKDGLLLDVRQLSDGERGLLVLVLDLAKRLSQANPRLSDPVKLGEAIVLIDELDLHLHPKWQRTIVDRLTNVFPRCQFIATTHSPQIVAAVEPEQVLLLTAAGVARPNRTLGMDSNWILRHLMEAYDRPQGAMKAIRLVEVLINKGTFTKARDAIEEAKKNGFDLPEWSVLEARMARLEVLAT